MFQKLTNNYIGYKFSGTPSNAESISVTETETVIVIEEEEDEGCCNCCCFATKKPLAPVSLANEQFSQILIECARVCCELVHYTFKFTLLKCCIQSSNYKNSKAVSSAGSYPDNRRIR